MNIKIGDKLLRYDGYSFQVVTVTGLTAKTIATDCWDSRARPYSFRIIDNQTKVDRILSLSKDIVELEKKRRELYDSLPRVEE